tara:strand:- start:472 stop:1056 length:585 start_codon:yes stop_codon:yes gene_type:complete
MHTAALAPLLVSLGLTACPDSQTPAFTTELPGNQEQLALYLGEHRLQEAAWECIKLEQYDRADSILVDLERLLHSEPVNTERWGYKGIMTNYLLTFDHSIQGFFKVAGSDSPCPIRNELAAYAIDDLLRIHLLPITLIRDLTLPDSSTVSGVIKYFVNTARTAENLELNSAEKPDLLIFSIPSSGTPTVTSVTG